MKIVELEILQSAAKDPNQIQGIGHQKYLKYVHCSTLSPQIFICFALRSAVFKLIEHFRIFPLTLMLKFQSQNIYTFIFPYDCLIYHKVWLRLDKNGRR